jgi:ABC-2 type transport system permease protein
MPIHDLGYRAWAGKYSSDLFRFYVIASTGIRVAGRNTWVRRVLLAAWLPTFALAAIIFGYERLLENRKVALTSGEVRDFLGELGNQLQDGDLLVEALMKEDLQEGRHMIWSWLLSTFLRVPQAVMTMLVIGMIAPPLIARDVRTRAFLMYFSKPLGRLEYVFGKMMIVSTYLMFITTVPALGCYLFGVALSSNLNVLADTWDLPLRIVLASLIFITPAVSVALMFSSLTSESRYAAFAWFAFWGLGFIAWNVTYGVMSGEARRTAYAQRANYDPKRWMDEAVERGHLTKEQREAFESQRHRYQDVLQKAEALGFADREQRRIEAQIAQAQEEIAKHPMSLVSLYDTLVRLQRWVFGLETRWSAIWPSIVVTVSVTLFAWFILLRNVSAPIRV